MEAFVGRGEGFEAVVEIEEAEDAGAVADEGVEGGEEAAGVEGGQVVGVEEGGDAAGEVVEGDGGVAVDGDGDEFAGE